MKERRVIKRMNQSDEYFWEDSTSLQHTSCKAKMAFSKLDVVRLTVEVVDIQ